MFSVKFYSYGKQAGLFSAVIATLFVESYRSLQRQPEDTVNDVLVHISMQLTSLTFNGNFLNSTAPSFTPSSFSPTPSTILVNTLWSLSLVIALITASLGILVKQWFHELMAYDTHDPKERLKLRFFREVGLERWKVFAIASVLPLLLQLALLLFFVGLSLFLHNLNAVVGWSVTVVTAIWLTAFLFTTLAPIFSSQCPYKMPMLKDLLHTFRHQIHRGLHKGHTLSHWLRRRTPEDYYPQLSTRVDAFTRWLRDVCWNKMGFEEEKLCTQDFLDVPTLVCTRDLLRGERLNEAIQECFTGITPDTIQNTFAQFRAKRSPLHRGMMPDISNGLMCGMRTVVLDEFAVKRLRSTHIGCNPDPEDFCDLYLDITNMLSTSYDPMNGLPIPIDPLSELIRLVREGPVPAAFSLLTMYTVRHRTLIDYPKCHYSLFWYTPSSALGEYL